MLSTNATHEVVELGVYIQVKKRSVLKCWRSRLYYRSIKNIKDVKVGDTITLKNPSTEMLIGYKPMKLMVYCGLFPIDLKIQ